MDSSCWFGNVMDAASRGDAQALRSLYAPKVRFSPARMAMLCNEAVWIALLGGLVYTGRRRLDPLLEAIRHGHVECVSFLAKRVDPCAKDELGSIPIIDTAFSGRADCLRAMAPGVGTDKNSRGIAYSALFAAAREGNASCVEALLGFCDDSVRLRSTNWTAMMGAIERGHLDCVKLLVEKSDFGVRAHDDSGDPMTAWDMAANFRDNGIQEWLQGYFLAKNEKRELEKTTRKGSASLSKARL